ncbi:DUF3800 domain-containing protein [Kitasatospora sp. NPDC001574]
MNREPVSRCFYLDDSGDLNRGIMLYGWIAVATELLPELEQRILRFRGELLHRYGIPVDYELHAHKFVVGRGRPGGRDLSGMERRRATRSMLDFLAGLPGVTIGSVFRDGLFKSDRRQVAETFAGALRRIDAQLVAENEYGELVIDGNGTDPLYQQVFDQVRPARIAGLAFAPAHENQWLQFADLVAYLAFQGLVLAPNRVHLHHRYRDQLPKAHGPERV